MEAPKYIVMIVSLICKTHNRSAIHSFRFLENGGVNTFKSFLVLTRGTLDVLEYRNNHMNDICEKEFMNLVRSCFYIV